MPENTAPVTELTSHYVNQVAGDLEQNVKEQERITAEITALQEQLATLQRDHVTLVSMQQALGVQASAGTTTAEPESPVVPAPRKKSAAEPAKRRTAKAATGHQSETEEQSTKKTAATPAATPAAKSTSKPATKSTSKPATKSTAKPATKSTAKPAAKPTKKAAPKAAQPTLIDLVRGHLEEQGEPRSAAEVAEALGKSHPDRGIQTKVVRTTLENLVARSGAQRTKQGSSVFYTVVNSPAPAAASEDQAEPAAAG
ncbi:hypothetical protein [Streptomyces sp. NPDC048521]|uniref:hypothetical protein n=1 Tax=Streptomyces sp. NPDC048521 TaxID=3365566 RepID=UPI00371C2AAF